MATWWFPSPLSRPDARTLQSAMALWHGSGGVCLVLLHTITDEDYADDIALLANTPTQTEILLHSLERAAAGLGLYINVDKTEYIWFNQRGDISALNGCSLKLVDKFTSLGSSVSSTDIDINPQLARVWAS